MLNGQIFLRFYGYRLTPLRTSHNALSKSVFVNQRHLTSSVERLANKTNKESGCCQTTIQEFERRMKQKFLVQGNEEEGIPKKYCDGEENVNCSKNKLTVVVTQQKKEREHWNTSYVSVCVPPSVEFAVAIIVQLLKRSSSFRYCFQNLLATRNNSSSQQPPAQKTIKSSFFLYLL